jgi:hypothetical protein
MITDVVDGKEIVDEIAGNHGVGSVASAVTDVSDEAAVTSPVAQTIERFGRSIF